MTTTELRGTSPHTTASGFFARNRNANESRHVKQFTPQRLPMSIKWVGFVGVVWTILGIFAIVSGLGLSGERPASGIFAFAVAATGLSMILTGPIFCALYHVAKAVLHIRDMTAHRHLGE
jgi:hypothetical protein